MIGDKDQTPVVQVYDEMNALKDRLASMISDIWKRLDRLEMDKETRDASQQENPS